MNSKYTPKEFIDLDNLDLDETIDNLDIDEYDDNYDSLYRLVKDAYLDAIQSKVWD